MPNLLNDTKKLAFQVHYRSGSIHVIGNDQKNTAKLVEVPLKFYGFQAIALYSLKNFKRGTNYVETKLTI